MIMRWGDMFHRAWSWSLGAKCMVHREFVKFALWRVIAASVRHPTESAHTLARWCYDGAIWPDCRNDGWCLLSRNSSWLIEGMRCAGSIRTASRRECPGLPLRLTTACMLPYSLALSVERIWNIRNDPPSACHRMYRIFAS